MVVTYFVLLAGIREEQAQLRGLYKAHSVVGSLGSKIDSSFRSRSRGTEGAPAPVEASPSKVNAEVLETFDLTMDFYKLESIVDELNEQTSASLSKKLGEIRLSLSNELWNARGTQFDVLPTYLDVLAARRSFVTEINSLVALHQVRARSKEQRLFAWMTVFALTLVSLVAYQSLRSNHEIKQGMDEIQREGLASKSRHKVLIRANQILRESESPTQAIEGIVDEIVQKLNWNLGHVLFVNPQTKRLQTTGKWFSRTELCIEGFIKTSEAREFNMGEDFPGRAAASGVLIWTEAIENDCNWPRWKLSPAHDLKCSVAVPIVVDGTSRAVLELFSATETPYDPRMATLLESIGSLIGDHLSLTEYASLVGQQAETLQEREVALEEFSRSIREHEAALRALTAQISVREQQLEIAEQDIMLARKDAGRAQNLFELSAKRFENLFESVPVACFSIDLEGNVVEWNRSAEALFHVAGFDALNKPVTDLLHMENNTEWLQTALQSVMDLHPIEAQEVVVETKGGTEVVLVASVHPHTSPAGEVTGALFSFTDITNRKVAEQQVLNHQQKLVALINSMQCGVLLISNSGIVEKTNPTLCNLLSLNSHNESEVCNGLAKVEFVDQDGIKLDRSDFPWVKALTSGEITQGIVLGVARENDGMRWLSVNTAPIQNAQGAVVSAVASFIDITEQIVSKRMLHDSMRQIRDYSEELESQHAELTLANQKLETLATSDGLTGLKNARALDEHLVTQFALSQRHGTKLSLIVLDVDHFKNFNDTFGHLAGDEVLKVVSELISENSRHTDFVARYGGEEFVVVLPHASQKTAMEAAERIRIAVESYNWAHKGVTVSIGASTFAPSIKTSSELFNLADQALYHSKQNGRNRSTHAQELATAA